MLIREEVAHVAEGDAVNLEAEDGVVLNYGAVDDAVIGAEGFDLDVEYLLLGEVSPDDEEAAGHDV